MINKKNPLDERRPVKPRAQLKYYAHALSEQYARMRAEELGDLRELFRDPCVEFDGKLVRAMWTSGWRCTGIGICFNIFRYKIISWDSLPLMSAQKRGSHAGFERSGYLRYLWPYLDVDI